jgi:hypothetical protein
VGCGDHVESDNHNEEQDGAKGGGEEEISPSQLIDTRSASLIYGSESALVLRTLIREAEPEKDRGVEWGVPVRSHAGIICTGESYKIAVKFTSKGDTPEDPSGL